MFICIFAAANEKGLRHTPKKMTTTDTAEQLRHVKRSLHGMMNGPVSTSMREKGLNYKVIFGVELPRLQTFAEELPHTYELAAALWKENIRECRLLATMLMPKERMDEELATIWVEQMRYVEEAECAVLHLFSHEPWASTVAFSWIAAEAEMFQLVGYILLARLFMQGLVPSERDEAELLDHVACVLSTPNTLTARAAGKTIVKFMGLGERQAEVAEAMLSTLG